MKFASACLLFLGFLSVKAQYVFVKSELPFVLENASKTTPFTSVWIKLTAPETPVNIVLPNGETLKRSFKRIEHPYYILENGRVRYRPNMWVGKADTVFIGEAASTLKTTPTAPPTTPQLIAAETDFVVLKQNICALQYEWEKTELIKEALADQHFTCAQIADLLGCLTYDASRVELINKHVADAACLPLLENLVAEPFKLMIIKR